jgi:hypothetical protein
MATDNVVPRDCYKHVLRSLSQLTAEERDSPHGWLQ